MTVLLAIALLLAQQTTAPEKCSLSGTVVDSLTGLPLGKVSIVAEHPDGHSGGASTTTDAKGNFLMIDVDPGQYRISATRNGYLDTKFGAKKSSTAGSILTLIAGEKLEDLKIKLTPFGVISGTVRDSDGEPLAGMSVLVRATRNPRGPNDLRFSDVRTTDDQGIFRFAGVPAGRYSLLAFPERRNTWEAPVTDHSVKSDRPREVIVDTWFPGTPDAAAAGVIEIAVGARASNADIVMARSPVYKVSAHVEVPAGLRAGAYLIHAAQGLGGLGEMRHVSDNDVQIDGVPPGNYKIEFGGYMKGNSPDQPNDFIRCSSTFPVTVGRGDVTGLRLVAEPCAEIAGHITVVGDEKRDWSGPRPYLALDSEKLIWSEGIVKADGSFSGYVSSGTHSVDLLLPAKDTGLYVKSMRAGNQDVLHDGLTASSGEHIDLEIVLAQDGGRVEGTVSDADGKPVIGAVVAVVPNDRALRSRLDVARDALTDHAGHFEVQGIAPGEYKVFAWDDIEKYAWLDPDVLKDYESKGQALTVKAGDKQVLKLTAIP